MSNNSDYSLPSLPLTKIKSVKSNSAPPLPPKMGKKYLTQKFGKTSVSLEKAQLVFSHSPGRYPIKSNSSKSTNSNAPIKYASIAGKKKRNKKSKNSKKSKKNKIRFDFK